MAAASGYVVFERPALFPVQFDGVEQGYEFLLFAGLGLLAAAVAVIYLLPCGSSLAQPHSPPAVRSRRR